MQSLELLFGSGRGFHLDRPFFPVRSQDHKIDFALAVLPIKRLPSGFDEARADGVFKIVPQLFPKKLLCTGAAHAANQTVVVNNQFWTAFPGAERSRTVFFDARDEIRIAE